MQGNMLLKGMCIRTLHGWKPNTKYWRRISSEEKSWNVSYLKLSDGNTDIECNTICNVYKYFTLFKEDLKVTCFDAKAKCHYSHVLHSDQHHNHKFTPFHGLFNLPHFCKIRSTRHDGIKCRQVNKDQVFGTQETSGNIFFFPTTFLILVLLRYNTIALFQVYRQHNDFDLHHVMMTTISLVYIQLLHWSKIKEI